MIGIYILHVVALAHKEILIHENTQNLVFVEFPLLSG